MVHRQGSTVFVRREKCRGQRKLLYLPGFTDAAAFEPVVIKSKYAEIIYFASPEYVESTLGTATPQYIDVDGDTEPG